MSRQFSTCFALGVILSAASFVCVSSISLAQNPNGEPQTMPSGQRITPLAPIGAKFSELNPGLKDFPNYTVGQAIKTDISPDGSTLLILTSGYNRHCNNLACEGTGASRRWTNSDRLASAIHQRHERFSTVNFVRTIEDVLGLGHLTLNDEYQRPMTAIFDLNQSAWTYNAITPKPIESELAGRRQSQNDPTFHDAQSAYRASKTRGFDWSVEDRVPAVLFNQIIWKGLTDGIPYPTARDQKD